jgi:hypothetical protein
MTGLNKRFPESCYALAKTAVLRLNLNKSMNPTKIEIAA